MDPSRSHLLPRPVPVDTARLENGILLLHETDPESPLVALHLMSRVGAVADPWDRAGRLNLAGSLLEAGTRTRSEDEIAREFEGRGTAFEVDVSKDLLTITLVSLADCFEKDLALLFDLITEPTFPDDSFQRECEMVRMAIMEREDDPLSATTRIFRERLYGHHPYAISALGTLETVDRLTRDDSADAVWTSLQPSELVASMVGGGEVHRRILRDHLERYAGRGCRQLPDTPEPPDAPLPDQPVIVEKDREVACVIMGFRAPSIFDPSTIAFQVLDGVLGGAMDSRLFRVIREERGLAYQVGSGLVCGRVCGHFGVYVLTLPENVDEVVEIGQALFKQLVDELVPEDELDRTIRYILGSNLMARETRISRSSQYGFFEALGLGYQQTFELPKRTARVVPKDVQAVAERYLHDPLVVISRPLSES